VHGIQEDVGFSYAGIGQEDHAQLVVAVTHVRLSHGTELGVSHFVMRKGTLTRIKRQSEQIPEERTRTAAATSRL
jgi:hypothetical protein